MNRLAITYFLLFVGTVILSGCGGGTEDTGYKLSGTISYDGKPVPRGTINFSPTSSGKGSVAGIVDGKFETETGHSGGEYTLQITGYDGIPIESGEGGMDENGSPLFNQYSTTKTLPEEDSTLDIAIPKN